jgi:hypothetical protein
MFLAGFGRKHGLQILLLYQSLPLHGLDWEYFTESDFVRSLNGTGRYWAN